MCLKPCGITGETGNTLCLASSSATTGLLFPTRIQNIKNIKETKFDFRRKRVLGEKVSLESGEESSELGLVGSCHEDGRCSLEHSAHQRDPEGRIWGVKKRRNTRIVCRILGNCNDGGSCWLLISLFLATGAVLITTAVAIFIFALFHFFIFGNGLRNVTASRHEFRHWS